MNPLLAAQQMQFARDFSTMAHWGFDERREHLAQIERLQRSNEVLHRNNESLQQDLAAEIARNDYDRHYEALRRKDREREFADERQRCDALRERVVWLERELDDVAQRLRAAETANESVATTAQQAEAQVEALQRDVSDASQRALIADTDMRRERAAANNKAAADKRALDAMRDSVERRKNALDASEKILTTREVALKEKLERQSKWKQAAIAEIASQKALLAEDFAKRSAEAAKGVKDREDAVAERERAVVQRARIGRSRKRRHQHDTAERQVRRRLQKEREVRELLTGAADYIAIASTSTAPRSRQPPRRFGKDDDDDKDNDDREQDNEDAGDGGDDEDAGDGGDNEDGDDEEDADDEGEEEDNEETDDEEGADRDKYREDENDIFTDVVRTLSATNE